MRLTDATEQFETHSYPATTEELIEAFGETELTLANGTETLGEILGRLPGETFESAEDANTAAYSVVSSKGIGRKHYSDRDPIAPGENGPDPVSL
ncbi:DUF5789 family protein [Halapricum salinum]|uniref:DUF2795 domain-containing protein n=1 Tax=Halapricum salinum TaxID=1457250 RepID=A0A4D6HA55_9EURY|nr:hypothetical protein [Halapricum salinum]QCC50690.1 DUF2795 domain-containing protein [Halapricum salinum]